MCRPTGTDVKFRHTILPPPGKVIVLLYVMHLASILNERSWGRIDFKQIIYCYISFGFLLFLKLSLFYLGWGTYETIVKLVIEGSLSANNGQHRGCHQADLCKRNALIFAYVLRAEGRTHRRILSLLLRPRNFKCSFHLPCRFTSCIAIHVEQGMSKIIQSTGETVAKVVQPKLNHTFWLQLSTLNKERSKPGGVNPMKWKTRPLWRIMTDDFLCIIDDKAWNMMSALIRELSVYT
jgi:hypothetical protein